jgi:glucose dehydrogenase
LTFVSATSAHDHPTASADFAPNDPVGERRMQARDFANTRYSTLNQINLDNVKHLRVAWTAR